MGLWSATRSESFLAVLLSTPLLTVDLVNEFTLVPLEETKIRYPSLHGNAGLSGILCIYIYVCVCVRAREGMHVHVQGSTFTTWAELRAQECWLVVVVVWWWRWAWGWHISANNHITHKDPHSNFLINSRRPPPPTGTALGAAVQQTVFRSRRAKILCFFFMRMFTQNHTDCEFYFWKPLLNWTHILKQVRIDS